VGHRHRTYSSLFIAAPILYTYSQPPAIAKTDEPASATRAPSRSGGTMELTQLTPAGRQVIERYAASGFSRQRHQSMAARCWSFPIARSHGKRPPLQAESLAPVVAYGGLGLDCCSGLGGA